jgi:hypothetical protein
VSGLISLTVWAWRLEIELTKERIRISERFLWRKNREQMIPLRSVKGVRFRSRGLRRQLVLVLQQSEERVIASGTLEETLRTCALAINDFLKNRQRADA